MAWIRHCDELMDTSPPIKDIVIIPSRMDQLQLWCPLLGVIIFLALFIWWCRSDDSCCDVERPFLYRCGCKKHSPRDVIEE